MTAARPNLLRDLVIVTAITVLLCAAAAPAADQTQASSLKPQAAMPATLAGSVRLHRAAASRGPQVLLGEVAQLEGNIDALGRLIVTRFADGQAEAEVTVAQVREALAAQNVNLGRVSLRGFAACRVERFRDEQPAASTVPPVIAEPGQRVAPVVANPTGEITVTSALTLRERLTQFVEGFLGVQRSDLRVVFSDKDAALLDEVIAHDAVEVVPQAVAAPGRLPLVVRRRGVEGVERTDRVNVDVARRVLAVVVKQSVSRGQTIAPGDVEITEVYLDDAKLDPLTDLGAVVGQVSGSLLRAGAVVYARDLRSPVMIRRGELVTVRCVTGTLSIRMAARAAEDGGLGDVILVRNEAAKNRPAFKVQVTGLREAEALPPDEPVASAEPGRARSESEAR